MGLLLETEAGASAIETFISSIMGGLSDFSVSNLGIIIVSVLGVTVGLALAWFAYRFIVRKVSGALKKGKM